jgi:hypothetical protein
MTTLSSITFLAGVVLLAACLTGIMQGIADDAEKRRLKRRAKYRCIAYAEVYRRRVKDSNRDELWRRYAE